MIKKIYFFLAISCFFNNKATSSEIEAPSIPTDSISNNILYSIINVSLQSGKTIASNLIYGSLKYPKVSLALSSFALGLLLIKKNGYFPVTEKDLIKFRDVCDTTIIGHLKDFRSKTKTRVKDRSKQLKIIINKSYERVLQIKDNLTTLNDELLELPKKITESQIKAMNLSCLEMESTITDQQTLHTRLMQSTLRNCLDLLEVNNNEMHQQLSEFHQFEEQVKNKVGQSFQEIFEKINQTSDVDPHASSLIFTHIAQLQESIQQMLATLTLECSTSESLYGKLDTLLQEHEEFLQQFNSLSLNGDQAIQ